MAAKQLETNKAKRLNEAKAEHKAIAAWEKAGRKGPRPDAPNYDAIHGEHETRKAGGTRKASGTPRQRATVRLIGNGHLIREDLSTLARLAVRFTIGCSAPAPAKWSATELRDWLTGQGVTDPLHSTWGPLTLPNGAVIEAVEPARAEVRAVELRASVVKAKAEAKASATPATPAAKATTKPATKATKPAAKKATKPAAKKPATKQAQPITKAQQARKSAAKKAARKR